MVTVFMAMFTISVVVQLGITTHEFIRLFCLAEIVFMHQDYQIE